MKLEDLVPPLEMCKRIPAGEFEGSALVWVTCGDVRPIYRAVDKRHYPYIPEEGALVWPAPTLAEILNELAKSGVAMLNCSRSDMFEWWECSCCTLTIPQTMIAKQDNPNPATAALKLWLEVNATDK